MVGDIYDTPVDNFIDHEIAVRAMMSVLPNNQNLTLLGQVFDDSFDLSGADSCNVGDALDGGP
jgi:hypothetical protein